MDFSEVDQFKDLKEGIKVFHEGGSQYTFGGVSACTIIASQALSSFLQGKCPSDQAVIAEILDLGAAKYNSLGQQKEEQFSFDQVYERVMKDELIKKDSYTCARTTSPTSMHGLLSLSNTLKEIHEKYTERKGMVITCIGVTVSIYSDGNRYLVFDSHGEYGKGAYFVYFASLSGLENYLLNDRYNMDQQTERDFSASFGFVQVDLSVVTANPYFVPKLTSRKLDYFPQEIQNLENRCYQVALKREEKIHRDYQAQINAKKQSISNLINLRDTLTRIIAENGKRSSDMKEFFRKQFRQLEEIKKEFAAPQSRLNNQDKKETEEEFLKVCISKVKEDKALLDKINKK